MKKKVCVSISHLMSLLLVYIVNILLFLAFRSYFFLMMLSLFTALTPLSFYAAWRLPDFISGSIVSAKEIIRQGDETEVVISITNRSRLCALRGTWLLSVGNSFYQTLDSQKLVLSVPPRGKKQFCLTVTVTDLGRIVFSCEEFFITDLLGIFTIHAACAMERSLFALPRSADAAQCELPDACSGAAELSESSRKGNDYSEVSDLRTYQPGDRTRDIHWKLSARQSGLMVKERVSLSGSEHLLLLELPSDKQQAQKLLTEGYHKIKALLDRHMPMRILIWNNRQFSFENYCCHSTEELESAYCEIFRTDLCAHSCSMLHEYMKNCYPQLESYLCVMPVEDSVQLEIYVNG